MVRPEPIGVKDYSHSDQQGGIVLDLEVVNDPERQEMGELRKRVGLEKSEDKAVLARGEMESQVLDSKLDDNEVLRRAVSPTLSSFPVTVETERGTGKSFEQIEATNKTVATEDESVTQEAPVVNRQHSYHAPVPQFSQPQGQAYEEENNAFQHQVRNEDEDVQMEERRELERAETLTQRKQDRQFGGQSGMVESQLLDCTPLYPLITLLLAYVSLVLSVSQRTSRPLNESNDTIINESSKKHEESAQKNQDTIQSVNTQPIGQAASGSGNAKPIRKTKRKVGKGESCECGELSLLISPSRFRLKQAEVASMVGCSGDSSETGGMVCCSRGSTSSPSAEKSTTNSPRFARIFAACDQWRHNVCYGYDDVGESLPDVFECYRCLAHNAELDAILEETRTREGEIKHALTDLQSLALFRRGELHSRSVTR